MPFLPSLSLPLLLLAAQEPAGADSAPAVEAPALGQPAPAHGLNDWTGEEPVERRKSVGSSQHFEVNGGRSRAADLPDLAGRVVLLHVFSPEDLEATRRAVPLLRDLVAANADRGVGVLSMIPDEEGAAELRESLGMGWPMARFAPDDVSPYLAPGLPRSNHLWLFDRAGFLAWQGDPTAEEKALLSELEELLARPAAPPLGRPLAPPLAKAAAAYAEGRWSQARDLADRLRKKHEGGADPAGAVIAEDARHLAAVVAEHEVALMREALEKLERRQLYSFLPLHEALRRGFPRSDAARQVEQALKDFRKGMGGGSLDDAEALQKLLGKRPLLFPARRSRAGDRLQKDLEKFTKRSSNDIEPTQRARYLLERYSEASSPR